MLLIFMYIFQTSFHEEDDSHDIMNQGSPYNKIQSYVSRNIT